MKIYRHYRKYRLIILLAIVVTVISIGRSLSKEDPVSLKSMPLTVGQFSGNISWNYQASSQENAPINLVGIHGTPGSWTAWRAIMQQPLISGFPFYAYDRPGWGESQSHDDIAFPSLADQADILAAAITANANGKANIIIAHSWGGPVALALASQYPSLIDGLVLIASPASAAASQPRWYHKAANLKPVQWIIGKSMTRSNIEMFTLDEELTKLEPQLASIEMPVVIMQGKKDWLVEPENAFYLQRMLKNSDVTLEYDLKANHFIAFKQADEVARQVVKVAKKITDSNN